MAGNTGHKIVTSVTLSFASTTYDLISITGGLPESCEPSDITVLSDTDDHFAVAGVTEDGEISATLANSAPSANASGTLSLSLSVSADGAAATTTTVNCGTAIVTKVEPATLEAGGNRVKTYNVTFKPTGNRS